VWYYRMLDGGYAFYDTPGFHRLTGREFPPVTKKVVEDWQELLQRRERERLEAERREVLRREAEERRWQELARQEALRREAEERHRQELARQEEEARRRAEEERQRQVHLAEMRSLVNVGTSVPGQINFAIVPQPARKDSPSDKVASSRLGAQIRTADENIRIGLDFFKPDFSIRVTSKRFSRETPRRSGNPRASYTPTSLASVKSGLTASRARRLLTWWRVE